MTFDASLDSTWTFTTEFGCKVLFNAVTGDEDPLVQRVLDMTGRDLYALRAYVDYRKPINDPDPEIGCGLSNSTLITDEGDAFENVYVEDYFSSDSDGAELANDLIDFDGASVFRKGWDYEFYKDVEPYSMVEIYAHGIQNSSVFAIQTDESVPAPRSSGPDEEDDYPKSETLGHFTVSVQSRRTSGDTTAFLVKNCVDMLPDDTQGDLVRVSLDPWTVIAGGEEIPAKGDSTFGKAFPAENSLPVGDCVKGWIGYSGSKDVTGLRYHNSLNELAEF